jgi:hypothetical protein
MTLFLLQLHGLCLFALGPQRAHAAIANQQPFPLARPSDFVPCLLPAPPLFLQVCFLVMANIFCSKLPIQLRYDLKGSTKGRTVGAAAVKVGAAGGQQLVVRTCRPAVSKHSVVTMPPIPRCIYSQ